MIKVIVYTYIFVRWTGGWGIHSGFGAFIFFCLWTCFMALTVCMAALGPALTLVSIARLFGANTDQIVFGARRLIQQPAGRALLFGHWGSMGLTALICYFVYYLTGNSGACLLHWSAPAFWEWLLLAWYGYSVYAFFKFFRNI